jgi:hypothetical protein
MQALCVIDCYGDMTSARLLGKVYKISVIRRPLEYMHPLLSEQKIAANWPETIILMDLI